MAELSQRVIDVFLAALSQQESDHKGPVGRLVRAKNVLATHYEPGEGKPTALKAVQRNGFTSLPLFMHNANSSTVSAVAGWQNPELLATLDDQLLSVANAVPRVFNGNDWSLYPDARVVTNRLAESVFHTSNHTIQAPDSAWLSGVTCSVWTESTGGATPTQKAYIGFKSDDGAWVRAPQQLVAPGNTSTRTTAKVITDGTRFWVVFTYDIFTEHDLRVQAYDARGGLIAETAIGRIWPTDPGYWDIVRGTTPNTCYLIQPKDGTGATDGVIFSQLFLNAGVINESRTTNATIHCRGPVAWLTNDLGDANLYFATVGRGTGAQGTVFGYQGNDAALGISFAVLHTFDMGLTAADWTQIDSLIGWPVASNTPGQPTLYVATAFLTAAQTVGPTYDPALRFTLVRSCTWGGASALVKQCNSVVPVSRAFQHDGEYHAITYYQSGAGLTVVPTASTPALAGGDYFMGAAEQDIPVQTGDFVTGSGFGFSPPAAFGFGYLFVSGSYPSTAIAAGDKLEIVQAGVGGEPSQQKIPDGTFLLKWTFAGKTGLSITVNGGVMTISGSSIPGADGSWDLVGAPIPPGSITSLYTPVYQTGGVPVTIAGGTFATAGTFVIASHTYYRDVSGEIAGAVAEDTAPYFVGGHVAASGSITGGNNGTFTIDQVIVGNQSPGGTGLALSSIFGNSVRVPTTTQVPSTSAYTAAVTPQLVGLWHLGASLTDPLMTGQLLAVDGAKHPGNNSTNTITGEGLRDIRTASAAGLVAENFTAPFPTVALELADPSKAYQVKIASLTPDYRILGGLFVLQGGLAPNNGVYTIVQVDPAGGTFFVAPTNGLSNQVAESLGAPFAGTVTIYPPNRLAQQFQPTWFMTPLTGAQAQAGCFDRGVAYADWRVEGDATYGPTLFPMDVGSVCATADGIQIILPYRAEGITQSSVLATPHGQLNVAGPTTFATTVGLKAWRLSSKSGQAVPAANELLLPGPMAGEFTASGFAEDGINLSLEQPFLISQGTTSAGQIGLTKGAKYQIIAIAEFTDENGNRIYSPPAPTALDVQLTGSNNMFTIGGRLPMPLTAGGALVTGETGTTCRLVALSVYSTVITGAGANAVPTTQHFKITDDLNINGLAPYSATNPSGFSFPDHFTWNFVCATPDVTAAAAETAYTDKGYLPRSPAPPFTQGVVWRDRVWVIATDGSIWPSGELTEGDAVWFHPALRIPPPAGRPPVALVPLEDYLIALTGEGTPFYLPAGALPDATGRNGALPTPVPLPFPVGCSGFAVPVRGAVVYSSTDRGSSVWMITRDLRHVCLSQAIQDVLVGNIVGLVVDAAQRIHVATDSNQWFIYDQILGAWFEAPLPTTPVLAAAFGGQAAFQDGALVAVYDPTSFVDLLDGVANPIAPDITLSSLNFGAIRNLVHVWGGQAIGTYRGPHRLNIEVSYPDDGDPTHLITVTPDPAKPYDYPIYLANEECSSIGLRIYADFTGVGSPGNTFELELVSFEVGVETRSGLKPSPNG